MANRTAPALALRDGDRYRLESMTRSTTGAEGLAQRAQIVLLAADGQANCVIADRVGVSRPTVNLWRERYVERGIPGLNDMRRPGRPRNVDRSRVLMATLTPPSEHLGVSHWSARRLGAQLGINHSTVADIWAEYGVRPWKAGTFRFSTDPELAAKVVDVVGLHLAPPDSAILLRVDQQPQIHTLALTQQVPPTHPGRVEQRVHESIRHSLAELSGALEIAIDKATELSDQHRPRQEFLTFLKRAARVHPKVELNLVMDSHTTHRPSEVRAWLSANPRIRVHFAPTSASWLNLIQVWFGMIECQVFRHDTLTLTPGLTDQIGIFINDWNSRQRPLSWTKPEEQIPTATGVKRKAISPTFDCGGRTAPPPGL